ncbi:Uncharacterised protein [Sphingobacterium multivorum]|uniref:Uncharacterized protein n=1 Tax=Sphingobacterium multivorum TaxID=28454 RepID=A0A2X2JJ06_SPHMU|nr:Uncharacterised protein [Sphingobacterium multivorum]
MSFSTFYKIFQLLYSGRRTRTVTTKVGVGELKIYKMGELFDFKIMLVIWP